MKMKTAVEVNVCTYQPKSLSQVILLEDNQALWWLKYDLQTLK